jgi:hypothetical protein
MKFQVNGAGWAIGQWLVPAGSVLDTREGTDHWSNIARGKIPPLASSPLDDEAHAAMVANYPPALLKFYGITNPRVRR